MSDNTSILTSIRRYFAVEDRPRQQSAYELWLHSTDEESGDLYDYAASLNEIPELAVEINGDSTNPENVLVSLK